MPDFETKDSGVREEYASGMKRDTQDGKARFDLMVPQGVPYSEQLLTRVADLLARGAKKYGDRNWEKGDSEDELDRAKSSAIRHLMQWINGEVDEDHAAAVVFNLLQAETLKWKLSTMKLQDKVNQMLDGQKTRLSFAARGLDRDELITNMWLDPIEMIYKVDLDYEGPGEVDYEHEILRED